MARIVFLLWWLLVWQIPGLAAETLVIPGTGSSEAILQELAGAFNARRPGQEVVIPPSIGSGGGLRALLSDQCAVARIVMPLDKNIDPKLHYWVFARDSVVFAVGAKVAIDSLTMSQLTGIFSGKITDWREVGGPAGPIRVIIRDPHDSILKTMQFYFKEFQDILFTPESKIAYHDAEMVDLLKKYKNSIGMSARSGIRGESALKSLAVDGISPSAAGLKNGNYRSTVAYALVSKKGSLPDLGQNFVDFIFSKEARTIIEDFGLIPAEPK
jgi:phosphate transport system substrate-binding protein